MKEIIFCGWCFKPIKHFPHRIINASVYYNFASDILCNNCYQQFNSLKQKIICGHTLLKKIKEYKNANILLNKIKRGKNNVRKKEKNRNKQTAN